MNGMKAERVYRGWIGTVAAATLLVATTALAADPVDPGKAAFAQYCSSCHGEGGKGDGPVADSLTPKPADLTQLAKKAGGEYPLMKVIQSIDGTLTVRAHGGSDMPVWGERFLGEPGAPVDQQQMAARGKILLIAKYLESLQAK